MDLFMPQYANGTDLPLSVALWLAKDDYDYNPDEKVISTTTLIKPLRQIILGSRVTPSDTDPIDVMTLFRSRLGSAIHAAIEKVWRDPRNIVPLCKSLGIPKHVAERISINMPKEWYDAHPNDIPVELEKRKYRDIAGMTVSGQLDFAFKRALQDFKMTNVFAYKNESNDLKYAQQGSIYRWLDPENITADHITIIRFFTDFRGYEANTQSNYPEHPIIATDFELASVKQTEEYLNWKIPQIQKLQKLPDSKLPECDAEDLWMRDVVSYKYWSSEESYKAGKRCSKSFTEDEKRQANQHKREKGKGIVVKVVDKGKARACEYCSSRPICNQYQQLKKRGLAD
ncbi:MAG: hypothetical protein Tp152SUR00d2C52646391_27 [Prokaryotic dsDNA virus sp.]|nr:MAG: hypothetical protein Tp152SUR00d2C52646391_27 [Prokaryotic dsDNA virus sp.]|tara:strand:- start:122 stop:1147 length:1026 start_codon:yes stop_codon:yes gene_type:complete